MLRLRRALDQSGDTIIEVMVVLAVLGMAIGISYSTASRSLLAARGAQESSEATQRVQGQVEYLRAMSGDAAQQANIFRTDGQRFCFDGSGAIVSAATFLASDSATNATYPAACVVGRYHISVAYTNPADDTFTATAWWDDVQGQGMDTTTLAYRVHKP